MKNWEKWESKIKEYGVNNIALNIKSNKIVSCDGCDCDLCKFSSGYNKDAPCGVTFAKWLYEEVPKIDWSKVEVNDKLYLAGIGNRYFSHYDSETDTVYAFADGRTSWSARDENDVISWNDFECELVEGVDKN